MQDDFSNAPGYRGLQPLRIPAGWRVGWNTLYATSSVANGDFGGSSLFYAENPARRFAIDVEFRPEFDPDGHFHLIVVHQPWPRTERGRRRKETEFRFDMQAETVHTFETRDYAELVEQLEAWIARCSVWVREGN